MDFPLWASSFLSSYSILSYFVVSCERIYGEKLKRSWNLLLRSVFSIQSSRDCLLCVWNRKDLAPLAGGALCEQKKPHSVVIAQSSVKERRKRIFVRPWRRFLETKCHYGFRREQPSWQHALSAQALISSYSMYFHTKITKLVALVFLPLALASALVVNQCKLLEQRWISQTSPSIKICV